MKEKIEIQKTITVPVELYSEDLALAFKRMSTQGKAEFFNEVFGAYANKDLMQLEMHAVSKSEYLDPDYGGLVIRYLGGIEK